MNVKKLFLGLILSLSLVTCHMLLVTTVFAAICPPEAPNCNDPATSPNPFSIEENFTPAKRFANIGQLFSDLFYMMIIVGAVIAIIYIIIGGIKMITGAGDPKQLEAARSTVIYAIVGLAVMALAFIIVQVVQYMLRSNIPVT